MTIRDQANAGIPHLFLVLNKCGFAAVMLAAGGIAAIHLERSTLPSTSSGLFLLKSQGLAFQRSAAHARDVLPGYGSPELIIPPVPAWISAGFLLGRDGISGALKCSARIGRFRVAIASTGDDSRATAPAEYAPSRPFVWSRGYFGGGPRKLSTKRCVHSYSDITLLWSTLGIMMRIRLFLTGQQITLLEKAGCFTTVFLMTSFTGLSDEPDKTYLRKRRPCNTSLCY
jgi:hypothetical protein